jgi:hypothetical protein
MPFLCHAKPKDAEQAAVWKKLVEDTLGHPDISGCCLARREGQAREF